MVPKKSASYAFVEQILAQKTWQLDFSPFKCMHAFCLNDARWTGTLRKEANTLHRSCYVSTVILSAVQNVCANTHVL